MAEDASVGGKTTFADDLGTARGETSGSLLVVNNSSRGMVAPLGNKFCNCLKVGKSSGIKGIPVSQPSLFLVLSVTCV